MNKTVVALGDSITYGFPFSPRESWVGIVAAKYGAHIINQGICGDFTIGMLNRFQQDVLNENPGGVIILGGYNDVYSGLGAAEICANLEAMCQKAREHDLEAVLALPTPVEHAVPETVLNECRHWISRYAEQQGLPTIDFYSALLDETLGGPNPGTTTDGVHPSREGYRLMAAAVDWPALWKS